MGIFFITLSLVGLWVGLIVQSETHKIPEWAGNVLAAITGGILGMSGNLVKIVGEHLAQKFRDEHRIKYQHREDEKERILGFLYQLQGLLLRVKTYQRVKRKSFESAGLIPRSDEINQVMKQIPVFPSWLDREAAQRMGNLIEEGFSLLLDEPEQVSVESVERWEKECHDLMEQIHALSTHL